jgi:predicted permease
MMRTLLVRVTALLTRRRLDAQLDEEVRAHLDLVAADFERRGMSPEDASYAARRAFGGVEPMKERYRDRRGFRWIEDAGRDVRHALRMMRRAPAFTLVAVVTLGIGLGANTALFSVVHDHVFRKLAVPAPDDLVSFRWIGPQDVSNLWSGYTHIAGLEEGQEAGSSFSFAMLDEFRAANQTLSDLVAFAPAGGLNAFAEGQAEFATGAFVSGNFHQVLGVPALAGRVLTPDDDRESATPVAVITEGYWRRRFSASRDVVDRMVRLNNVPVTVVGVMPSAIGDLTNRGVLEPPDFAIPLWMEPRLLGAGSMLRNPANWWVTVIGRMRPGVTPQQAEANFASVFQRGARQGWEQHVSALPAEQRTRPGIQRRGTRVPNLQIVGAAHGLSDVDEGTVRQFRMLAAIFAIGLAVVCVNLVNLLLSRSSAREREIAVRIAAGATRGRIVRQLLTESTAVGILGAVAGMPMAAALRAIAPDEMVSSPLVLDWPMFAFSGGLSILTSLLLGLIPAIRVARRAPHEAPKAHATFSTRIGVSLMVAQVSLSLVLLSGAAILGRTVVNLQRVDVGFDAENIVLFTVEPGRSGYDRAGAATLYERIANDIRRVPGVRAVTIAGFGSGFLWRRDSNGNVFLEGQPQDSDVRPEAKFQSVDVSFFDTMGVGLRRGRTFTLADAQGAPMVAVVNEAFVKTFFSGRDPIGSRFAQQADATPSAQIEIVGVVNDVRVTSLRDDAPPMFYRPVAQTGSPARTVVVRTTGDAESLMPAIAAAMRAIDPRLPLRRMGTQEREVNEYVREERMLASAAGAFGGLSLTVSMIGLFGLVSYGVARRTREIGIRIAVGAQPRRVLGGVLGETLVIVGVGIVIGAAASFASGRALGDFVFGLSPHDPASLAGAVALVLLVALAATVQPARRASRIDPVTALRSE